MPVTRFSKLMKAERDDRTPRCKFVEARYVEGEQIDIRQGNSSKIFFHMCSYVFIVPLNPNRYRFVDSF